MTTDVLEWAMKLGFPAALAAFLIWQNHKQQSKLVTRLTESEDWIRVTLVDLAKSTAESVRDNTLALRESARVHRHILEALSERPCLRDYRPHEAPQPPPERRASGLDVGKLRNEVSTERIVKP